MDADDIIDGTSSRADIDSRTDAESAVHATLETLGEHVTAGEAEDIADRLPDDVAGAVTTYASEQPESFSVDEFAARVASREGDDVDPDEAVVHARATFATLAETDARDELLDAREQLPNEFDAVFETDELDES